MNENEVINEQNNGTNTGAYATALAFMAVGAALEKACEALWFKVIKPMFNKKVNTDTQVVKVETPEEE